MGAGTTILIAIILLVVIAIIVAILRPIYTMKVIEPGIYENRLSFWKYAGVVIIATIIVYVLWLLMALYRSRYSYPMTL
jgi:Ca2+/H+ antiporter